MWSDAARCGSVLLNLLNLLTLLSVLNLPEAV